MKKIGILVLLLAASAGVFFLIPGKDQAAPPPAAPVTVYAASSLKEAVTEITSAWTGKTGIPVRLQFEATSTLARQIQEGAPADLFLTAAPEWLDKVKVMDRYDWLGNRLVAVRRKGTAVDLKKASSLALANEQVPAGKYAKVALGKLGIKIPERTVYGENVRDVLSKVSHGAAEAGVVYATDVAIDPDVEVCFEFPEGSHPPVLYSAGLLRESGRGLFAALKEPWVLDIAHRRGFLSLK